MNEIVVMVSGRTSVGVLGALIFGVLCLSAFFTIPATQAGSTFSKSDVLRWAGREVDLTWACTYYDSNFAATADPVELAAAPRSMDWVNKQYVVGDGRWEALISYTEHEPVYASEIVCQNITDVIDNLTGEMATREECYNEQVQTDTRAVTKERWEPYNWDRNALHLRFCADLVPVLGPRSIEYVPSVAGYSFPEYDWWNMTGWNYRVAFNVTELLGKNRTNEIFNVTINFTTNPDNVTKEIRVLYNGTEMWSWANCTSISGGKCDVATIYLRANFTANQTRSFEVYYGNPFATPSTLYLRGYYIPDGGFEDDGLLKNHKSWLNLSAYSFRLMLVNNSEAGYDTGNANETRGAIVTSQGVGTENELRNMNALNFSKQVFVYLCAWKDDGGDDKLGLRFYNVSLDKIGYCEFTSEPRSKYRSHVCTAPAGSMYLSIHANSLSTSSGNVIKPMDYMCFLESDTTCWSYDRGDSDSYSAVIGSEQYGDNSSANESAGRDAIVAGIDDALGSGLNIKTDRREYAMYDASPAVQNTSIFDKVVTYGNQTWAFNYLTGSDSASGMLNMTPVFYVWEKSGMPSDIIITEVSDFIEKTKNA